MLPSETGLLEIDVVGGTRVAETVNGVVTSTRPIP